jgi:hypothetical protein
MNDPEVLFLVLTSLLTVLQSCVDSSELPCKSDACQTFAGLLCTAAAARIILRDHVYEFQAATRILLTRILPAVAELMVMDQIVRILPQGSTVPKALESPPIDTFTLFAPECPATPLVMVAYISSRLAKQDAASLSRCLSPTLVEYLFADAAHIVLHLAWARVIERVLALPEAHKSLVEKTRLASDSSTSVAVVLIAECFAPVLLKATAAAAPGLAEKWPRWVHRIVTIIEPSQLASAAQRLSSAATKLPDREQVRAPTSSVFLSPSLCFFRCLSLALSRSLLLSMSFSCSLPVSASVDLSLSLSLTLSRSRRGFARLLPPFCRRLRVDTFAMPAGPPAASTSRATRILACVCVALAAVLIHTPVAALAPNCPSSSAPGHTPAIHSLSTVFSPEAAAGIAHIAISPALNHSASSTLSLSVTITAVSGTSAAGVTGFAAALLVDNTTVSLACPSTSPRSFACPTTTFVTSSAAAAGDERVHSLRIATVAFAWLSGSPPPTAIVVAANLTSPTAAPPVIRTATALSRRVTATPGLSLQLSPSLTTASSSSANAVARGVALANPTAAAWLYSAGIALCPAAGVAAICARSTTASLRGGCLIAAAGDRHATIVPSGSLLFLPALPTAVSLIGCRNDSSAAVAVIDALGRISVLTPPFYSTMQAFGAYPAGTAASVILADLDMTPPCILTSASTTDADFIAASEAVCTKFSLPGIHRHSPDTDFSWNGEWRVCSCGDVCAHTGLGLCSYPHDTEPAQGCNDSPSIFLVLLRRGVISAAVG